MNIWIVTIGSSDVQLKHKRNWTDLFRDARNQLKPNLSFTPDSIKDSDRFRVPARVIGFVYSQPHASLDDLDFPLINIFINKLKDKQVIIHNVILVLSDQSIFPVTKRNQRHPYWQDTCTLQPILEKYLTDQWKDVSPNLEVKPMLLEALSEEAGLDNWDATLTLVQQKFASPDLDFPENATIYVSHQAGTPALSAAVQFCSLAKFTDRVRFLVSNEYNPENTGFVESSSYLKGIKKEQAKKLLENYDYAGVEQLIGEYLTENTRILLSAALQWNYAKFDEFANELAKLTSPDLQELVQQINDRRQHWWWSAYESAYLAITRLDKKQDRGTVKDTVDALFHSFRAIEGLFAEWGIQHFQKHIQIRNDRPYLQTTILDDEQYFMRAKYKNKDGKQEPDNDIAKLKDTLEHLRNDQKDTIFYGFTMYTLFREVRQDWKKNCKSISRFWDSNNGISEKRNKIFHQLRGLSEKELFEIWEVNDFEGWKERILEFANFISNQDFQALDREGTDGQVASLMVKVHAELQKTIDLL